MKVAPQYRRQGNSLFKLNKDKTAYIHVYVSSRYRTLSGLVNAYESKLIKDEVRQWS